LKEFLKYNKEIIVILIIWTVIGAASSAIAIGVIPLTIVLLKLSHRYKEIFFGLIYVIILSDSRLPMFGFAGVVKGPYLILMAVFLLFDRKYFVPFNNFVNPFYGFFIIALICTFFSPEGAISFQKLLSYFLLYLVLPNYISLIYKDDPYHFLRYLVYFIIFLLIISILLYFPLGPFLSIGGRYSGILGNPNALGLFSAIFLIVLFIINDLEPELFGAGQKRLFLAIIIINILLSRSRTSMLTVFMFLIFSVSFKRSFFVGIISVILLFITNVYITEVVQALSREFGLDEFLRIKDVEKGSGRLIAWEFGWKVIMDESFFLGRGFNYTNYIYEVNYERLSLMGHQGNAHNSYITFWIDTGILGLILFMYGYIKSFFNAFNYTRLALPAMFAFAFSMFFESWFCASQNPFTLQVVMILTIASLPRLNVMYDEIDEINELDENHETQISIN
jgi:O-antigen ligase